MALSSVRGHLLCICRGLNGNHRQMFVVIALWPPIGDQADDCVFLFRNKIELVPIWIGQARVANLR